MANMGFHEWAGHGGHAREGDCPEGTMESWEGFVQGGRLPTGIGGGETGPWGPRVKERRLDLAGALRTKVNDCLTKGKRWND